MLFGEHAVLRGSIGIVAAIDCRLQVRLTPLATPDIVVVSALGTVQTNLKRLSFGPSFRFIEAAFRLYASMLPSGAHLEIVSSINPHVGLGSSASVTVALLACLQRYVGKNIYPKQLKDQDLDVRESGELLLEPKPDSSDGLGIDKEELLRQSCQVIKTVQGFGSGADAASIIYGDVISYNAETYSVQRLSDSLPLVLAYSGFKTPTPEVIRLVNESEKRHPTMYRAIFSAIAENAELAALAIKEGSLELVGTLMNQAQGLMQALGVSTPKMTSIWLELVEQETILGAKISGSGLGDCVIGLGKMDACTSGAFVDSKVSQEGVRIDG